MLVKKFDNPAEFPKTPDLIKEETVMYIWAEDGWLYIPQRQLRRKFITTKKSDVLEILDESWSGTIPLCEYMEKVQVFIYSVSPLMWKEDSSYFSELYLEITSTENKSK